MIPSEITPNETVSDQAVTEDNRPLMTVRDLCVSFQARRTGLRDGGHVIRALDGVSFDLLRGETLGVVGESGCGKTTLGRSTLGLVTGAEGEIRFDGTDVLRAGARRMRSLRRKMQMVFQDPSGSLNPRMRISDIVAESLVIHRVGDRSERLRLAGDTLERVGLRASDAHRFPHELSGGQRQRVGIARAIILKPRLVVCDEPVSALDVSIQSQILNLLSDLKHDLGLTYLFISHDLAVVRHICDRVAVMLQGRFVEVGETADIFDRPQHAYTKTLLAAAPKSISPGK